MTAAAAAAGRQASNINAPRINRVVPHDLPGDPRDQRRFAAPVLLVGSPLNQFQHWDCALSPAATGPDRRRYSPSGIGHGAFMPSAGGKILGRLGAAVQHQDSPFPFFFFFFFFFPRGAVWALSENMQHFNHAIRRRR